MKTPQGRTIDQGEPARQSSFLIRDQISEQAKTVDSSMSSCQESYAPSTRIDIDSIRVGRTIGSGSTCKVHIAKDDKGNEFAMKILNKNKVFRKLIDIEVETLSIIKHPNIVNLV